VNADQRHGPVAPIEDGLTLHGSKQHGTSAGRVEFTATRAGPGGAWATRGSPWANGSPTRNITISTVFFLSNPVLKPLVNTSQVLFGSAS